MSFLTEPLRAAPGTRRLARRVSLIILAGTGAASAALGHAAELAAPHDILALPFGHATPAPSADTPSGTGAPSASAATPRSDAPALVREEALRRELGLHRGADGAPVFCARRDLDPGC